MEWYSRECRALPWRESRDSYRVWISEAMLQQTRVETVLSYWPRFVERFPTLEDLSEAEEDEVLALWSGLGYYNRARKLREAAIEIVRQHGGEFPRTREEALALAGVGPYTAGAVLSIAYDLPEALVDGNVQRVFSRLFGIDEVAGSTRMNRLLWSLAGELVPRSGGAGTWNQAVMELGATVCVPRSPRCGECPVRRGCVAHREGRTGELPRMPEKREPTLVQLSIFVAEREGAVLLEQRPAGGRMAGLWQFPTIEVSDLPIEQPGELFPRLLPRAGESPVLSPGGPLGALRHSITRYSIRAEVHSAELVGEVPSGWRWFDRGQLEDLALTGMARKVLRVSE
jgi:A/G-specific adenine glycosylase